MTRFVSLGYGSIVQNALRLTVGVMLVLATGCDRSDLVALRMREPDAGAKGGASASSGDASALGSGGAGGNAGGRVGASGASSGIGGAAVGSGGGGDGSSDGGTFIGSGGASGNGAGGSGGATLAGDAGVHDAGSDSSRVIDAGAQNAPDAAPDAWVPQTCAVGSVPTPGGCEPVPLATKMSVGFAPCRIRTDGTLWCWGAAETQWSPSWQEAVYETQVGSASDWTSVTVGDFGICGIRAPGTVWCLGRLFVSNISPGDVYQNQPVQIGADEDWLQIAGGRGGFCGIKQNGTLWCWGALRALYPEASTASISATPVQVGTDSNWSFVSTNSDQTCAIRTNGSLECFGTNSQGQLGDGTTTSRGEPMPILETGPWVSVAVGAASCGVRFDGTLWCWGSGLGGTSTLGPSPAQFDASTDWTAIAVRANYWHTLCGLRAGGRLMCNNPTTSSWPLAQIDTELGYTSVAGGCAEHQDGTLRCWGYPARGDGSRSVEPEPVRVGTATDWTAVALSGVNEMGLHAGGVMESKLQPLGVPGTWLEVKLGDDAAGCAIRADHTLWCAGNPWVQQGSASDWLHVTVGYESSDFACGIREGAVPGQGTLWCSHQLSNRTAWEQADSRTDWVALSSSRGPCGIHADGSLTCWTYYQTSDFAFTDIGADHDWASVSAPVRAQCAIKTDASLWCWGGGATANAWGQLGDGTRTDSPLPEHIAPGTHWAEVASGSFSACGVQTDGLLWCWGLGGNGQLGIGVPGTQRLVPTRVGNGLDWQHIAVSGWGGTHAFACGIRSGGELWCWGSNFSPGYVSWSTQYATTPHVVVDPPPPGGGQFCAWPFDNDLDGYAACLGDCDDRNPDVNPSAVEICNGIDDNCDGAVDEGCP